MSTPAHPARTASLVSRTESGRAQHPVPGTSLAGSMPSAISASSSRARSSTESELASLVVPKMARPLQPFASNQRQCRIQRGTSGSSCSSKGVTAGASTPARAMPALYPSSVRSAAGSAGTRQRDARLDLAPAVPDGDELPGVADVVQRVGGQDEKVGALALLQRPPIRDAEHGGAPARRRDDGLHRREPCPHHQLQLVVLRPAGDAQRV